jgi:hypothetical protein
MCAAHVHAHSPHIITGAIGTERQHGTWIVKARTAGAAAVPRYRAAGAGARTPSGGDSNTVVQQLGEPASAKDGVS